MFYYLLDCQVVMDDQTTDLPEKGFFVTFGAEN